MQMNTPPYHAIYLSPHLDDAALSCGGQIFQQTANGQRVLIVTITAGDPPLAALSTYVQSLHERWQLASNAAAARRAEDLAASQILGAETQHWPLPDCIYRFDPVSKQPLYVSDADIFGAIHPSEQGLVDELVATLRQLPSHERLYVPLTIGHHVDHQLTRLAAERAFGPDLTYYEDYPYAQTPGALAQVIPPGATGWQATTVSLTEAALQVKIEAILAFRSQLSTFFTDRADLERQVRGYATLVGGERVWQPPTAQIC
jgi:LmbE family N-acetylglucosaminyl deacetylase